jgi:hypothetical protein
MRRVQRRASPDVVARSRVSGRLTSGGREIGVGRGHPGSEHRVQVAQPLQQYTTPWRRMPRSTAIGQPHHGQRMFAMGELYRPLAGPSTYSGRPDRCDRRFE